MSDVAVSAPVTAGYLAALKDLGFQVGDGERPPGPAKPPASFYPYAVLYTGTARMEGTLVQPHEDGVHRLQVSCVGLDRKGAEYLRDLARAVLLNTDIEIEGHAIVWTELVVSRPIFRDDDVTPHLFNAVDIVHAYITPAPSGS